jgi:hypothetical protein
LNAKYDSPMLLMRDIIPEHQNAPSEMPSLARDGGIMSGVSPHAQVCTVSAWLSGRLQWRCYWLGHRVAGQQFENEARHGAPEELADIKH